MTVATLSDTGAEFIEPRSFSPLNDRCDRCGATAMHAARKDRQGKMLELLFCGHHFMQHGGALLDQGWRVLNNYDRAL